MGQAQILAAALFLLLIPTTIIVAQNATDNITGDTVDNFSLEVVENATENIASPPETNITLPENTTNITIPEENTTINITPPFNETNITLPEDVAAGIIPEENITINITPPLNGTNVTLPDNQTFPEPTNETSLQNQTQEQPDQEQQEPEDIETLGPVLEVNLHMPERANRNEPFPLSAEITNSGDTDARDVEIEWILPDGLSILEGGGSHYCDVPAGATCTSELRVAASLSSELGEQEIKILVRYLE